MWTSLRHWMRATLIALAFGVGLTSNANALVTNFVACLGENYRPIWNPPIFTLTPEDGLGWGTVHVWRQQCYNDPSQYALLMVVVPRASADAPSLVSGKLIEAWQYGRRVGIFTLKQNTRDLLGYTGYLMQERGFILGSTQGADFPLDETLSMQLVFTTGGAKSSLWVPGLTPLLDVFQYSPIDSSATLLVSDGSKEANLLKNWNNKDWNLKKDSFRTWRNDIDGGVNMHRFFKKDANGHGQYFYFATGELNQKSGEELAQYGNNEGAIFTVLYTAPNGSCGDANQYRTLYRLTGVGGHQLTANADTVTTLTAQGWQLDPQKFCIPR